MEQAGIVAVVRLTEISAKPLVYLRSILQGLQTGVGFDHAVCADTQKYDPVYDALNGEIEFALREPVVAQGDILRQILAPGLDFPEKSRIDLGGALLFLVALGVFVEGALENRFFGEDGSDFLLPQGVLLKFHVQGSGDGGFVGLSGLNTAVVNGELLEIG